MRQTITFTPPELIKSIQDKHNSFMLSYMITRIKNAEELGYNDINFTAQEISDEFLVGTVPSIVLWGLACAGYYYETEYKLTMDSINPQYRLIINFNPTFKQRIKTNLRVMSYYMSYSY